MSLHQDTQYLGSSAVPILMRPGKTMRLVLDAPIKDVYAFVSKPKNLPHWAPNFCVSIAWAGDQWRVQTANGSLAFRLAEPEAVGVLDHVLTLNSGEEIFVKMRLVALGNRCEIRMSVPRAPNVSNAEFEHDVLRVEQDLYTLKCIVECLAALATRDKRTTAD